MRVSCPSCAATYEVPDHLIGAAGRKLRCARCGAGWVVQRPDPSSPARDAAPPTAAGPVAGALSETGPAAGMAEAGGAVAGEGRAPPGSMAAAEAEPAGAADGRAPPASPSVPAATAAAPADAAEKPDAGARPGLALAWAATVIVVVGGVVLLYLFREAVMEVWPPSIRLFAALGLAGP